MTAAEHAATVREAAERLRTALKQHLPDDEHRHGLLGDFALLRNWAERATELEAEVIRAKKALRLDRPDLRAEYLAAGAQADAAEARVTELEAELTEWRTSIATERLTERAERAETALREMRDVLPQSYDYYQRVARAALGEIAP